MKVQHKNASAEKTKKKIRQAFISMHSEGIPGDRMTIKDLAKRAEISRSTFYTHYTDLYAVGEEMASEMIRMVMSDERYSSREDVRRMYLRFLDVLCLYEQEMSMLFHSDYPVVFLQQLQAQMKMHLRDVAPEDEQWNTRAGILIDGSVQQLIYALRKELPLSVWVDGMKDCCNRLL